MKLVLDTNILFSALIKDSLTREILLFPSFEFYLPEYSLTEIQKYKSLLVEKTGLTESELSLVLNILLERVTLVPLDTIKPFLSEAEKIMKDIDRNDIPFLALSLSFQNDGIWTQDKDFERQKAVRVWKTEDLLMLMKRRFIL